MNAKKFVASAILLGGLSACGTLGQLVEYDTIETELWEAGYTPAADMPDSGGATYEGVALGGTLLFRGAEVSHAYIGDASIDVAFTPTGGTVGGEVTNLTGAGPRSDGIVNVGGTIVIDGGVVNGSTLSADYAGDLTLDGDDIALDGTLSGDFYGQGAPVGVELWSGDDTATVNGVTYIHGLTIVAN